VFGVTHVIVTEIESIAADDELPTVYIDRNAGGAPTTQSAGVLVYGCLHRSWFDIVGDRPCLAEHIVVLHELFEEVDTKTVVVDLLVAAFAVERLLHFGRAVEQLEIRGCKKLAFLVFALADDDFEEVEETGEIDRKHELFALFESLQECVLYRLVGHDFPKSMKIMFY